MRWLWLTFGFGVVSAVIPLFNMEAYITVVYARSTEQPALLLAFVGSLGQNIGKLVWYYASRGALDLPWLRRRMSSPKRMQSYERWRARIDRRPATAGLLVLVSAATGFPPFFAMAMVAGTLRMNVGVFFVAGLVGRTLFFWALLLGVGLLLR